MVINIVFIILQECDSTVSFRDIAAGKFEVVISHPEALLCTSFGCSLLDSEKFCQRVVALVIDECHTIDLTFGHTQKQDSSFSDPRNFITVPLVTREPEQTTLLF